MSEDVRRTVGRNVRKLRTAAGLSQAELAERMGVDRAYVSGLELGQRNPTIVTLWYMTKALGVNPGRWSRRKGRAEPARTPTFSACGTVPARLTRARRVAIPTEQPPRLCGHKRASRPPFWRREMV